MLVFVCGILVSLASVDSYALVCAHFRLVQSYLHLHFMELSNFMLPINQRALKLFLIIGFHTIVYISLLFILFAHFFHSVVMLCCCFRFRLPRTKQEIEADYQRRIIAKNFRDRLANIKNCEMDEMNLQKGELIQFIDRFELIE